MANSIQTPYEPRLLPALVDELAQSSPGRILYSIPIDKDLTHGFRDVSVQEFSRAVDRCAWHIVDTIGPGHAFPTLTYMGPQDLVYAALILACNKTGYKLLLNSLRNPLKENLQLLDQMECNTFLTPPKCSLPMVKNILAAKRMRVLEIPSIEELFSGNSDRDTLVKPYPYTKTFEEAKFDPFVVLHTSGSTGSLKPIIQTHATIASIDCIMASSSEAPPYPAMCRGKRMYVTFPLFHCGGIHLALPGPIYCDYTVILGPFPPSPDVIDRVHVYGNVQYTSLAAVTLNELAKCPEYLDNLRHLEHVAYGGSPCPKAVGDLVATKTRLKTSFGTTEAGAMPTVLCDPEDWEYIKLSPLLGAEFRYVAENLYEQIIVRSQKLLQYQGIFGTFPELQEWSMKDLYTPHPSKSGLWKYVGRLDDVIVYCTGEKFNPLGVEGIISSHPKVQTALITGSGRTQSCLLIEPNEIVSGSETSRYQLLDTIWPTVELANAEIPSHARIHRDMILITSVGKPMLRAGKGTIQRKATLNLYEDEINALYRANDDFLNRPSRNKARSHMSVELAVKDIIAISTDIDPGKTDLDADLFQHGLDSLQVTLLVKETNDYLSTREVPFFLNARTVYANPTIKGMTAVVTSLARGKVSKPEYATENSEQMMRKLYNANIGNLPPARSRIVQNSPENTVALLTGSTGSLGSYVLDLLANDPHVSLVYCLNRGAESRERQVKSQERKGLRPIPEGKVKFIEAEYSKTHLGLQPADYEELLGVVTTIIHNAWRVDFNLTVESFSLDIAAVTSLVDFAARSNFGAKIFFLSSIGAVANWQSVSGVSESIPEAIFDEWEIPDRTGYAQSKFISERVLDTAAKEVGVVGAVCRDRLSVVERAASSTRIRFRFSGI
ncbi:hypothetical protein O1611_g2807 [Lasiodiplodia mahajangana]|uniref:Uncharacterized protein n=1 Tax=Lasiodiplodia mahajangana TaxID=1108764 RepID=A0ACC2JU13_9PEZI|nr:hypothetical protein O1611_g2807 [Lasiodiplodia mahajangana]